MANPKKILNKEKIKNYISAGYSLDNIFNNLCLQFDDMESYQLFQDFQKGCSDLEISKKYFDN